MSGPRKLQRWRRGDAVTADRLNRLQDAVVSVLYAGKGIGVRKSGKNVVLENTAAIPHYDPTPAFFEVNESTGDYIQCHPYDPISGAASTGTTVDVAKPYMLRKTPFDGETITYEDGAVIEYTYTTYRQRSAESSGIGTETQIMTPDYYDGEVIRAVRGNTGVTASTTSTGDRIGWEDINTCGRFWARKA